MAVGRPRTLSTLLLISIAISPFGTLDATVGYEPAEAGLIEFGLDRFEAQGLDLPNLTFEFHEDTSTCDGRRGGYSHRLLTIRMCGLDEKTMLHELAHAWANHILTDDRRAGFARLRGLASWNDPSEPWEERATEHAAEVIAWGLSERTETVRYVRNDGVVVHRLLTISNSSAETLHAAFVSLTGADPLFRNVDELSSASLEYSWQQRTLESPERMGARLLPGMVGIPESTVIDSEPE